MRFSSMLAVAGMLMAAGSVAAQTPPAQTSTSQPPAADGPNNPAIKTDNGNNAANPVAGANSFTEAQAKARIEARGYTQVSGLTKDPQGVWRGKATMSGKPVTVSLDFQGNVIAQ